MSAALSDICTTPSPKQDLTFAQLQDLYAKRGLPLGDDFCTALNLRAPNGKFNYLAYLLADKNTVPLGYSKYSGFDHAIMIETIEFGGCCLAKAATDLAQALLGENTIRTKGLERGVNEQMDLGALCGAVAAGITCHDWLMESSPTVELFCDRMEVSTLGNPLDFAPREDVLKGTGATVFPELARVLRDLGLTPDASQNLQAAVDLYGEDAVDFSAVGMRVTLPFVVNTLYTGKYHTPLLDGASHLAETMGSRTMTMQDMMREVNETYYPTFLERFLQPALSEGLVEKAGEDLGPDSREQLYRCTVRS